MAEALAAPLVGASPRPSCRPVDPADEAFLVALFRDDRRDLFAAAGLPEAMLERLLAQQYRAHEIGCVGRFPAASRQVIVVDAVAIGRLTTAPEPCGDRRALRIVDVALRPEWRGRGLGAALLADLARTAAADGFARLTLSALRHDQAVQRLYRRLGFAVVGGDETHVAMVRDLDAPAP